jgi:O-antigen/teichoic acid export membrane protein
MILIVAPLLPLLLGAKWTGVVSLVPGVALGGLIQALLRTGTPLFVAVGKPRLQFTMDAASALGVLVCIYPLSKYYGLAGLAWSYAVGTGLGLPLWWRLVKSQSGMSGREIIVAIFPTLIASAILAIIIEVPVKIFLSDHILWFFLSGLAVLSIVGTALFFILIMLMERLVPGYQPMSSMRALLKNYSNASKGPVTEVCC